MLHIACIAIAFMVWFIVALVISWDSLMPSKERTEMVIYWTAIYWIVYALGYFSH